jgi:hypothetical protein
MQPVMGGTCANFYRATGMADLDALERWSALTHACLSCAIFNRIVATNGWRRSCYGTMGKLPD